MWKMKQLEMLWNSTSNRTFCQLRAFCIAAFVIVVFKTVLGLDIITPSGFFLAF